jgi:hypothetical protein
MHSHYLRRERCRYFLPSEGAAMTKTEIEIAKIAYAMVKSISHHVDLIGEQHDSDFAEQVYNSVALTMLTKICLGIAENNGTAAFESYWSDVDSKLREMIEAFACMPTKH